MAVHSNAWCVLAQLSLRVGAMTALRDVVVGLGEAGAGKHADCLKIVSRACSDKREEVRSAAGLVIPSLVTNSRGFASVSATAVLSICVKVQPCGATCTLIALMSGLTGLRRVHRA